VKTANKYTGWILLMVLCCALTYSNHFFNAFHFDDFHTIVDNAYIRDIRNIPLFFKDGSTSSTLPPNQSYRPVVTTSLAVDYRLGHQNVFFFHLTNFLLFVLQGIGMVFLFKKIFDAAVKDDNNIYFALAGSTWYLLHPAMAETVNYIIARSDIISTVAVVAAFILYIYSPFCRKTGLYLICIVIGTLAKPPAVMFAPILFIYILFFEEKTGFNEVFTRIGSGKLWNAIKRSLPSFIICAATYLLTDKLTPKTWTPGGHSAIQYLITQPFVVLHYFYSFFLPLQLSVDTDWVPLTSIWDIRFFVGCIFIIALLITAFIASKKQQRRPVSFGICWFLLALLPTSSIIPLAEVLNDHRMYFPFIGLMISVCWTIKLLISTYLPEHKKLIIPATVVILICYAFGTWQRNRVWFSEETLWRDAVIKSPANGRAWMNYAVALMGKNKLNAAEESLIKASTYLPGYDLIYVNLGILKASESDTTNADIFYRRAIAVNQNDAGAWYFYGRFLYNQIHLPQAVQCLSRSIELSPNDLQTRLLLMDIYQSTNNWTALQALVQSSVQLFPANADVARYTALLNARKNRTDQYAEKLAKMPNAAGYIDLSLMYYRAGDFVQCVDACRKALKLKPNYSLAYNNMCAAYNKMGQWDNAILAGDAGLKIDPQNVLLKNNHAAADSGKLDAMFSSKK
jgi:protein O-mannosyl-transferase